MEQKIIAQIEEKVNEIETPFFIYNKEGVLKKIEILRESFLNKFTVFYSMKANPNEELLKELAKADVCVEVASSGEIIKALKAGIKSDYIMFTGPGKEDEELELAIDSGIYSINVESINEIKRVRRIIADKNKNGTVKKANISIRINPPLMTKGAKLQMSGTSTQFGIPINEVEQAITYIKECEFLDFKGFHIYYGSGILQEDIIISNFINIFSLVYEIQKKYDLNISFIDFGGGFGEACFENEKPLDMDKIRTSISTLIDEYKDKLGSDVRLIIESGRFIAQNSGYYVCKVLRTGIKNEKRFAVLDGGIHHISPVVGFGSWLRKNYPIHVISSSKSQDKFEYDIWGPNNTISDLIEKDVLLPKLRAGDYIILENVGSYMNTVSPRYFCSRALPKEILI